MCLAIPARIEALHEGSDLATVDLQGVRREVNIALVREDGVDVGSWVLIHVGFAMSIVDEAEAKASMDLMRELFAGDEVAP